MNNIIEDFCDNYCKYPLTWDEEKEGCILEDGKCKECPLSNMDFNKSYNDALYQMARELNRIKDDEGSISSMDIFYVLEKLKKNES